MKITRVDAFAIGIGDVGEPEYLVNDDFRYSIYGTRHQTVIARVETDAGVIGYGEGQSPISPETTKTIVETALRPILLGRDPLDSSALWYRMYSAMRERGHQTGFYPDALAAVDIALWDIKGKATGLPVYKLLGGAFRDRVPVYNGVSATTPAEAAAEAKSHAEAGYGGVKLHIRGSVPETAEVAEAVRDAVGPGVKIMVDVHTYHSVSSAIALGRRLEAIDATWLESPLVPEDIGGLVELSRALDVPVASSEWTRTRWDLREAFERRALDIVMPDIGRTGLTEGMAIATLADTYNIPVAPHIGGGGIFSIIASIHYSAAIPNFFIMEHNRHAYPLRGRIAIGQPEVVDGAFPLPDRPGLGIEISDETLAEYSVGRD